MAYTIPGAKIYVNAVRTSFNGVITACSILTLYLFVRLVVRKLTASVRLTTTFNYL